ncbi:uncharacterized protein LOC103568378 [Microplitis demolitor]|uniref:uncharacterized protein LOC103568378 n=1 Tax=Microplitis demolitor TaxID=69319 RepID=UPI0004CCB4D3|nr:uncharacterized protein LOC103568378 [Microplitis demolitor]
MNNSNNFGKYTLSNDSINKLLKCEDLIKPTYQPSDSTWHKLFIEKHELQDQDQDPDVSMDIDHVIDDLEASADEPLLQSSQFFFTQVERKIPAAPVALKAKGNDLNNIAEVIYESLEQSKKLNTEYLNNLSDQEVTVVMEKLSERCNLNNTYDLCNFICDMDADLAIQYIKVICSKLLLQKIIDLEEPTRLITVVVSKLLSKFPQDIQKLIFIPIINADLKDTSVVLEIVKNYPRQQKLQLISDFLTVQELKDWHVSIIPSLINIKIDNNMKDRLIKLLVEKSTSFSKEKNYSKFILSFIKLNPPFTKEQKSFLDEIVAVNETIFKKAMENILNSMYLHRDLWHIKSAN